MVHFYKYPIYIHSSKATDHERSNFELQNMCYSKKVIEHTPHYDQHNMSSLASHNTINAVFSHLLAIFYYTLAMKADL